MERVQSTRVQINGQEARRALTTGATVFAVLVPSALAYSSIVGVSPVVGLVGVPFALLAYALAGGSSIVVVGADAAVSVMVASAVVGVAPTEEQYLTAVLLLSLCVGAIFLLFRALRLGWIADIIPQPVLKGFVQGLVWTTIVGQLAALLGLDVARTSVNMFVKLFYIASDLDTMQVATAITGVSTVVALVVLSKVRRTWPTALIVLLVAGVVYAVFDLGADGVSAVGEPTGALINTSFSFPDRLGDWSGLVPGAFAIVVLAFTEHLGAVQMVADARDERIDPDRELLGLGVANLAVGLGSSFAVTGALSKTSVAIESGARTKWTNVVTAVLAIIAAIAFRPMFDYLANAVLAGIVVWGMIGMIDRAYFSWLWKVSRIEFAVSLFAFFGVMVLGVMPAVIVATVLGLLILGQRISRPTTLELGQVGTGNWRSVAKHPDAARQPGIRVARIGGLVVFLNARVVADRIRKIVDATVDEIVVLDCAEVSVIDTTAQRTLASMLRSARAAGRDVRFADVDDVVWEQIQRAVAAGGLSPGRRYLSIDAAIEDRPIDDVPVDDHPVDDHPVDDGG